MQIDNFYEFRRVDREYRSGIRDGRVPPSLVNAPSPVTGSLWTRRHPGGEGHLSESREDGRDTSLISLPDAIEQEETRRIVEEGEGPK